jgi:hypothetical protein
MCTVCAGPVPPPRVFYGSDKCNVGALRDPRIPMSVVFGVPPGLDGVLTVRAEHGDILFTRTGFARWSWTMR